MSEGIGYAPPSIAELEEALRPAPRFEISHQAARPTSTSSWVHFLADGFRQNGRSGDADRLLELLGEASQKHQSSPAAPVALKSTRRRKMVEPVPAAPQLGMPALLAEYAREFYLDKPLSLTEIAKSIEREMGRNFVDAPEGERQKRRATMESIRRYSKFKPLKYRRIMDLIRHVFAVQ
jgi:hypothetical protein